MPLDLQAQLDPLDQMDNRGNLVQLERVDKLVLREDQVILDQLVQVVPPEVPALQVPLATQDRWVPLGKQEHLVQLVHLGRLEFLVTKALLGVREVLDQLDQLEFLDQLDLLDLQGQPEILDQRVYLGQQDHQVSLEPQVPMGTRASLVFQVYLGALEALG